MAHGTKVKGVGTFPVPSTQDLEKRSVADGKTGMTQPATVKVVGLFHVPST